MLAISQLIFAVFKIFWNAKIVPFFIESAQRLYLSTEQQVSYSAYYFPYKLTNYVLIYQFTTNQDRGETPQLDGVFEVFILLLNNVAIPCVATAAISSNCFYNALFAPAQVTSSYSFSTCSTRISILGVQSDACFPSSSEVQLTHY